MFGYLTFNKPELKIREYERYREFYCGLCHELGEKHGLVSRASLSYDLTFVALLLTALYEPELKKGHIRCILRGGKKKKIITSSYSEYAADMNILLTYYKAVDDWHDEKSLKGRMVLAALQKRKDELKLIYPDKVRAIAAAMKRTWELENYEGVADEIRINELAIESGKLFSAVMVPFEDEWSEWLSLLGFCLGKFIYLCDAYEDYDEDMKNGSFNPLKDIHDRQDFEEWIKQLLLLTASDAAAAFEKLPIVEDAELIRNILYAGIWQRYMQKKKGNKKDE